MNVRLAHMDDLPQLKAVYKRIITHMNENDIRIWDEIYPCEFFADDIEEKRLYVLTDRNKILSAFALCDSSEGEKHVKWETQDGRALYLDRFGVNTEYLRNGIGSAALEKAATLAKEMGAEYLRLFVVDINIPAMKLYQKYGFKKADGIYHEVIDHYFVLDELGFERKVNSDVISLSDLWS